MHMSTAIIQKNYAENSNAQALDKDDHLDMYIKKIWQN